MTRYLGETSWETVDGSADPSAFVSYLDRLDTSPLMRQHRKAFLNSLPLRPGDRILDAGCGTGADTLALKARVGHSGWVMGLDASRQMVRRARDTAHNGGTFGSTYTTGSICDLPVATGTLDGLICNRVLMHLRQPVHAVREMARVLKPGGWLGLCEPDWSKAQMQPDSRASQAILATHCASFENGAVGGLLSTLVKAAGCEVIADVERRGVVQNYKAVWPMLNLERSISTAKQSGVLSQDEVQTWQGKLEAAAKSGTFRLHMVGRICIGRKGAA